MSKALSTNKLPPLKSLRGFESAARLLSFRKAAQELNLTHPAISHQIQALEENLQTQLFERGGRQLLLTAAAKRYYPMVREALELLINHSEIIRRSSHLEQLKVQSYVTTSIRWLAQRLSRFRAQHPKLSLQLVSSVHEQGFDPSNADLAIIFSLDKLPSNLHWTPLFKPTLFPVCSPKLGIGDRTLSAQQLREHPLISVTTEVWQWSHWFDAADIPNANYPHLISTDSSAMAIEMAMDGEGIALINGPFVDKDLIAGRLIVPSAHQLEDFGEWGIACSIEQSEHPQIKAFSQWLVQDVSDY